MNVTTSEDGDLGLGRRRVRTYGGVYVWMCMPLHMLCYVREGLSKAMVFKKEERTRVLTNSSVERDDG